MSGRSSAVERHLAKVDVESSILFARSNSFINHNPICLLCSHARLRWNRARRRQIDPTASDLIGPDRTLRFLPCRTCRNTTLLSNFAHDNAAGATCNIDRPIFGRITSQFATVIEAVQVVIDAHPALALVIGPPET